MWGECMSVEMKLGMRREIMNARKAFDDAFKANDSAEPLSPTPACADQAGTATASTVSTEAVAETLRRMRAQHQAINREACAYRELAQAAERATSDLDEAIKRLEKEHDL